MKQMSSSQRLNKKAHNFSDELLAGTLYGVLVIAILPVAMLAAMTGWRWQPWPPGAHGYRAFFREARIVASTATATALSV
jgi:hypothetical protein